MSDKPFISVVSPVFLAESTVDELVRRVSSVLDEITDRWEMILVEDGSPDGSWDRIAENAKANSKVRGIRLSRNFGQHSAISAGLDLAEGDCVIVMDCDLQDDPSYIPEMLEKTSQGYDVVFTTKTQRSHSFIKNIVSKLWHSIFNWLATGRNMTTDEAVGAFSLLTRKVVLSFRELKDYHRHYLFLVRWLGFRSTYLTVEHRARFAGRSSYSLGKLVKHAIDGITSQSTKLLNISIIVGVFFCILSVLCAATLVIAYFVSGFREGWTSIATLILLSTGINLMSLGVIGMYLGRTFEQSKQLPLYVISERVN